MLSNNPLALAVSDALDQEYQKTIRGSKGGGSQRAAVESPDSLKSIANARIIDIISEGEIEGFAHGNDPADFLQDIYYNETPVQNADGSRNFKNVIVEARMGTQDQDYIPGFPAVENEIGIGVNLLTSTPWTRSYTNLSLSAVRVRLAVSSLTTTDQSNGDIKGGNVQYAIDIATDGGAFTEVMRSAFNGKSSGPYERGHRIDLPPATTSGWVIRVRRLTADSASAYVTNATSVVSTTEIIDGKFRYPLTALVAHQIDASQFQSIPTRAFHMKGRRIKVPANYNPVTRQYATSGTGTTGGAWDGTFKVAYSNNPAWVFYDLVTNARYGLGHLVREVQIDKWNLYSIGQYCDGTVEDGFGGTEPRMTCNLYLQQAADAYRVLGDLASVFRGITYWAGGSIVPVADRAVDPVYTYTNGNVVDGLFKYEGSSIKARHTAVVVSYNDMTDFGRIKSDYYDDEVSLARYGYQPTSIHAVGCTSRGQARRLAKWILLSERLLTNTVNFSVGLDGTFAAPGQIVRIADKHRAGRRIGGRVSAATTTTVTLDNWADTPPAIGDTITVNMPNGVSQTRVISAVNAGLKRVTVSSAFSPAPQAEHVWAVDSNDLNTQLYRVLAVAENDDGSYGIYALQHNPSLFDAVDFGEPISVPPFSTIPSPIQARPASVTVSSVNRAGFSMVMPLLTAKWPAASKAVKYRVQWQKDDGEWSPVQEVSGINADYDSPWPGKYRCKVSAVNAAGIVSPPQISSQYTLADPTERPGYVEDLEEAIQDAMDTALEAQDIADGSITTFYQASAPSAGVSSEGDIWFDTDDKNKIYTYRSGSWVATRDSDIANAINNAATAQATADGKIKTFFQSSAPTASGVGDLWVDTDDKNKLYRWSGSSWVVARDTGIGEALTAAQNAQAAADGKITSFYQASPPTIGFGANQAKVGDIWFETDQGNRVWRVVGSAWVSVKDDDLAAALNAAAGAQATADGKVQTFFQSGTPTATAVGDLWFNTNTSKLFRWSGSNWTQNIGDVTLDQLSGSGTNLLWDEYSSFDGALPAFLQNGTDIYIYKSADVLEGSLAMRCDTTYAAAAVRFTSSGTDWNLYLPKGKYVVSMRTNSSTGTYSGGTNSFDVGVQYSDGTYFFSADSGSVADGDNKKTFLLDTSSFSGADPYCHFIIRPNLKGQANGGVLYVDKIMLETMIGNNVVGSAYSPGPSRNQALAALSLAATAKDTADGKIETFFQASAPSGASLGDLWFETDQNNRVWRYNGSSWVDAKDSQIATAINAAAGAQATADGKVTTYYAASAPGGTKSLGDLWYDTSTKLVKRWNGSTWIQIADVTADKLAGTSVNLVPAEFSCPLWADPQALPSWTSEHSVAYSTAAGFPDQVIYRATAAATSTSRALRFGNGVKVNASVYNMHLTPGNYIVSATVRRLSGSGSVNLRPVLIYTGGNYVIAGAHNTISTSWTRISIALTVTVDEMYTAAIQYDGATSEAGQQFDIANIMVERMIGNDPTPSPYSPGNGAAAAVSAAGLRTAGSGARLGDQRNYLRSGTSAYGMIRTTTALSATSAGAVSVNAHTVRYGSYSASYSAVSNAVTGLTQNTTYVIYCSDPDLSGGTKTYYAGTNPEAVMNISDDIYVVGQIKIPTSGSSSGGGGGGGTNPDDWCVAEDSYLPDGTFAMDLEVGDLLPCYNNRPEAPGIVNLPVQANRRGESNCYRMETKSGAAIIVSETTPMTLRDGSCIMVPQMLYREALVYRNGEFNWEEVVVLNPVGKRQVAKISVSDQCYFAGLDKEAFIATHNIQMMKP